ncbi:MAG TPA: hypothetical protein VII52_13525 [Gemmatimonadaceae bacterium]
MNWPYIHTLINHFPIILTVVGTAVLFLALIVKHRAAWLYALATLTLAGASVYPAFYTGGAAAHALRDTWYVVRAMVEEHDQSASYALVAILVMGAVSAYAWRRMLRRDVAGIPPIWLRVVVTLLAVFGLSVVTRTAYLGGKIIHESPKLAHPPANVGPASVPPR